MPARHFGAIGGIPVGATFADRVTLARAGVHRPTQAGISGANDGDGADSVVLSDGYVDDAFAGDAIVYTGQGGRSSETKRQVRDQPWNGFNRALAYSQLTGRPVRVSRLLANGGEREYRYEGLYAVRRYWRETGRDGFFVWRFLLTRLPEDEARAWGETWPGEGRRADPGTGVVAEGDEVPSAEDEARAPYGDRGPAPRTETTVQRIVRDTAAARRVKRLHDHRCQFCATRVETPAGAYAEAAHVRPLGTPHDGPDVSGNLLCLCPNCHVRFDLGAVSVADDGTLLGMAGTLRTARGHRVGAEHLAYHREHVFHLVGEDLP